jgi:hypothetical protein|tara:strand:+ start:1535 stop:1786 length:252 start_codon:yes stop_codon:yes gene_type:complete
MDDTEVFDIAIRNSYKVLFENKDEETIINSTSYYFAHDPFHPYSRELLITMLDYFISKEEYEKCEKINKELPKWNSENIRRKL